MRATVEVVREWHETLNQGDLDKLASLVHLDVVISGPRGTVSGVAVLREWFERANIKLHPITYFGREAVVVVEEDGEWMDPTNGEVIGRQHVATLFEVVEGLITRIVRHDQLEVALSDAGLTASDRA